jgi:hypothetical protein
MFWLPKKYIETLYKSTIPKLITWVNSDGTKNLEKYFNQNNSYKHLNYANEETYLISHNITKDIVIKNSITHIIQDIEEDELHELIEYFLPLIKTKKIKVLDAHKENEKAVYVEIISYLEYIQKIKILLIQNKIDNRGDKFGTGFRKSSLQKIVDTKITRLEDRLNDPHCPTSSQEEIDKINLIIKMLKKSQEKDYANFFEYGHIINALVGLDVDVLELNDLEKKSLQQAINFHNGKSCSDIELIRSSMIFLNMLFYNKLNDAIEYSNSILNIMTQFFNNEMSEINKMKNQLTFNIEHITKPYALKTTLEKTFIYLYSTKESPLDELFEIAFKSMAGLENKFEPDNLPIEELSEDEITEKILTTLKNELQLNEDDIQVFKYFFTLLQEGKIPLPHLVQ